MNGVSSCVCGAKAERESWSKAAAGRSKIVTATWRAASSKPGKRRLTESSPAGSSPMRKPGG